MKSNRDCIVSSSLTERSQLRKDIAMLVEDDVVNGHLVNMDPLLDTEFRLTISYDLMLSSGLTTTTSKAASRTPVTRPCLTTGPYRSVRS